jgi:SAM-dependent methyltransferase
MALLSDLRKRLAARLIAGVNEDYEQVVAPYKRRLFAGLRGDVLEIGPGDGVNLRYYPHEIRWVGIEPNPYLRPYLQAEAARLNMPIDLRSSVAEHIDAPDHSMDTVVGTLVLCSVANQQAVLREVLRVLRPGGRFLFIEHVAAPRHTRLRHLQNAVRPVWQFLVDGCQPNRETWRALEQAGFAQVSYERFDTPVAIVGPHIAGQATK